MLKWAAAVKHPLLQSLVLADQREEAARGEERVQGHLNAMALRLGDLQAQMMRLDGLGERLAKIAGLNPQELQSLQPGKATEPVPEVSDGMTASTDGAALLTIEVWTAVPARETTRRTVKVPAIAARMRKAPKKIRGRDADLLLKSFIWMP